MTDEQVLEVLQITRKSLTTLRRTIDALLEAQKTLAVRVTMLEEKRG